MAHEPKYDITCKKKKYTIRFALSKTYPNYVKLNDKNTSKSDIFL